MIYGMYLVTFDVSPAVLVAEQNGVFLIFHESGPAESGDQVVQSDPIGTIFLQLNGRLSPPFLI